MIMFIAPHPYITGLKGGVESRISAIDEIFNCEKRIYFHIALRHNWVLKKKKINEKLIVYQGNFFLHGIYMIYLCMLSKFIYCHTLESTKTILPLFFLKKIIIDMHGILPEEIAYANKPKWKISIWNMIEKFTIKHSYIMITVTKQMKEHYVQKYKLYKKTEKILNIPIFIPLSNMEFKTNNIIDNLVVYAGSLDAWQCIDKMVESIKKVSLKYKFNFYFTDIESFRKKLQDNNIEENKNLVLGSVSKEKLFDIYQTCDLGLILREDNIINKVACPTKLIEYIYHGIIPIMNNKNIGDFSNIQFVSLEDFILENLPDQETKNKIRWNNFIKYKNLYEEVMEEKNKLKEMLAVQ